MTPVRLRFRVRFAETDAQAVVYYGSYFTYFEMGRVELLRQAGMPIVGPEGALYVVHAACDYHAPARFDDELELASAPLRVGRSSFSLRHVLVRPADGARIAEGRDVVVFTGPDGRPAPLPGALRAFLCAWHDPALAGEHDAGPLPGWRRVAVGSTNPAKVEAVRAVFARLAPAAEVRGVEVESGVAAQPLDDAETARGAERRARAALVAAGADLGVGMEAGLAPSPWGWLAGGWCVAVDREGRLGAARSAAVLLPEGVSAEVRGGAELGAVIDRLSGVEGSSRRFGALGYLSRGLHDRRASWEAALAQALAPWLRPALYAGGEAGAAAGAGGDPGGGRHGGEAGDRGGSGRGGARRREEEGSPLPLRESSRGPA